VFARTLNFFDFCPTAVNVNASKNTLARIAFFIYFLVASFYKNGALRDLVRLDHFKYLPNESRLT
jgi:hypothetical protein